MKKLLAIFVLIFSSTSLSQCDVFLQEMINWCLKTERRSFKKIVIDLLQKTKEQRDALWATRV